jgi:multiple sugar transport system permease protein
MPAAGGFVMTARKAARIALAAAFAALILWSFAWVIIRELGSAARSTAETELVVLHWSGEGGPEEDEIVERSLRAFEAAHPGVTVRRINPGDAASFYTKLQTMLASGKAPDVFYVGAERVASFAAMGLLAPLDERVAADVARGDAASIRLEDLWPQTVAAFRFDGATVGEGPLYGIPKDFTTVGFYLNKDVFAKAGVPLPAADWTWDDYVATARRLKSVDGIVGSEFVTWPMMVRAYLRTEGVDTKGATFDDSALGDPTVRSALDRLRGWRHDETGTLTSGKSKLATGAALFTTGTVGMAGPFGRWVVPEFRRIREFDWDFLPLPQGTHKANVIATVAWAVAAGSPHQDEAWKLVRWLTNEDAQREQARLGLAIPSNRRVAESPVFLDPTQKPENDAGFLAPLLDPDADVRVVDWPSDPVYEQLLGSRLDRALLSGSATLEEAIAEFERDWAQHRQSPLARGAFGPMPWRPIAWFALATVLLGAGAGLATYLVGVRRLGSRAAVREERAGLLMAAPWVLGFAAFMAFPIVMSFFLSLTRWNGTQTLERAEFVGLGNYAQLLFYDDRFRRTLWVTFYYVLVAVPGGQLFALLAAMLLNRNLPGIRFFWAAWYLPSILAGVGVAVLWRWVFDPEAGILNRALAPLLGLFGSTPPEWFGVDAAAWGPPAFGIMSLWLVGGSMMVYLAALRGVPQDLYEAAEIDGVSGLRRFLAITVPMLSPVILFNSIMALIGSFQVFTQAFVMTAGEPGDLTRFYVLYLYNQAFDFYAMGYASAMAWILFAIVLALTVVILRTSRGFVHYESLRR